MLYHCLTIPEKFIWQRRENSFPFATQLQRLQISTDESPAYSKDRVYPSNKPTPWQLQLQPTQQQPKPNFVTLRHPYYPTLLPATATTFVGAALAAAAASASHAPPPTAKPT
ncbi:hypothetical protein Adt_18780 [Abeliophyllum distichum]|uniref:Uncharacterized protein n=1 Tax=Abeliophyllum distichum TaxID=126358 RepID=A0ABD1TKB5_9LAMI